MDHAYGSVDYAASGGSNGLVLMGHWSVLRSLSANMRPRSARGCGGHLVLPCVRTLPAEAQLAVSLRLACVLKLLAFCRYGNSALYPTGSDWDQKDRQHVHCRTRPARSGSTTSHCYGANHDAITAANSIVCDPP